MTELKGTEKFWYYTLCIVTAGHPYFIKIATKKALHEYHNEMQSRVYVTNQHNL